MKKQRLKRGIAAALLASMALSLAPAAAQSATVRLSVASAVLSKGDKINIDVQGSKETKGAYASSNKNVASVSKKGVISAKKTGNAVITWKNGKRKLSCQVRVVKAPGIQTERITLKEGESRSVDISRYGNSSLKVSWSSSNTSVARVTGSTVTGVSAGTATVTARIQGKRKIWGRTVAVTVEKAGGQTSDGTDMPQEPATVMGIRQLRKWVISAYWLPQTLLPWTRRALTLFMHKKMAMVHHW